jgi:hypothetical protein
MSLEVEFSAGCFPIITGFETAPGTHGEDVAGMHGIGVRTPNAAAVALATVGFERLVHIPKGIILTMGLLSMIFASGAFVIVLFSGNILSTEGAIPKEHMHCAPEQIAKAITQPSFHYHII